MKNIYTPCLMFALMICISCNSRQNEQFTNLSGIYLGQEIPELVPMIFAPGVISTEVSELCNAFSPNCSEFYYTSRIDGRNTILFTKQINGKWTIPEVAEFSGNYSDVDPYFSADGSKLFFSSKRPINNNSKEKDSDIWFVERTQSGKWQNPKQVEIINSVGKDEYYTSISDNGTLYFSVFESHDSGGNIFKSTWENGIYSSPELISYPISSNFNDHDPYIAPDESYLIFASTREGGYGKEDLYISFLKSDNTWDTPINMGNKINTEGFEFCPMVSYDGKYLFFTRNTNRNGDIYWVNADIIKELKLNYLQTKN